MKNSTRALKIIAFALAAIVCLTSIPFEYAYATANEATDSTVSGNDQISTDSTDSIDSTDNTDSKNENTLEDENNSEDETEQDKINEEDGQKYTVKFVDNINNEISTQKVSNLSEIVIPDAPEKEDYKFTGWNPDISELEELTEDLTIRAEYKEKFSLFNILKSESSQTYYLYFMDSSKGYESILKSLEITSVSEIEAPDVPEIEGFTSHGWYIDDKSLSELTDDDLYNGSTYIYAKAKYTREAGHKVSVTFYDNNNSIIWDAEQEVDSISEINPPDAPSIKGFNFLGWVELNYPNRSLSELTDNDLDSAASGLKLKAEYERDITQKLTINFYGRKGDLVKSQEIGDISELEIPEGPDETGYEFIGWYTDKNNYAQYLSNSDVYDGLGIYAKYNMLPLESVKVAGGETIDLTGATELKNSNATAYLLPDGETLVVIEFSRPYNVFNGYPWSNGQFSNVKFAEDITFIGKNAFFGCDSLKCNLTLPDSLTIIEENAFLSCSGLTGNLVIPDSVTTIEDGAFSSCSGLTGKLTLPDSLTTIGNSTFSGCSGLTGNLIIPDSVTSIGEWAFSSCRGLTGKLTLPDSLTTIGNYAFYHCENLSGNLVIPNSVTSIGEWAFSYCKNLSGELVIPNSVTSIGNGAFSGCSKITTVSGGNNVISIGEGAFDLDNIQKPVITAKNFTNKALLNYDWARSKRSDSELVTMTFVNKYGADFSLTTDQVGKNTIVPYLNFLNNNYNRYKFFKDELCTEKWDLYNDIVTEDITLYVVPINVSPSIDNSEEKFKVTFEPVETSETIESVEVTKGSTITKPDEKFNYYKDKNCREPWDFENDTIEEETTIYFKPIGKNVKFYFRTNFKEDISNYFGNDVKLIKVNDTKYYIEKTFKSGDKIEAPEISNQIYQSIIQEDYDNKDSEIRENRPVIGWALTNNSTEDALAKDYNSLSENYYAIYGVPYYFALYLPNSSHYYQHVMVPYNGTKNVTLIDSLKEPDNAFYLNWEDNYNNIYDLSNLTNTNGKSVNVKSYESDNTYTLNLYPNVVEACKVTFETNGGSKIDTVKIRKSTYLDMPENPDLPESLKDGGHEFGGWYTNESLTNKFEINEKTNKSKNTIERDMTLYVKWKAKEYTITINPDNGTKPTEIKVEHGKEITEPETPEKEGYEFIDWYPEDNPNTPWDFDRDKVTENITIIAKWKIKEFKVTFNPNGGTPKPLDQTVEYNKKLQSVTEPTKEGNDFIGWFTNDKKWDFNKDTVSKDVELIAKWSIKKYTITIDSNNGTKPTEIKVEHGDTVPEPEEPTNKRKEFLGWYPEDNPDTPYDFTTPVKDDVKIIAKWGKDKYQITFDSNGGTEVPKELITEGDKVTKPSDPTRGTIKFIGWFIDKSFKEEFDFDNTIPTEDITLIAKWDVEWTVTFDVNGGTPEPAKQTVEDGRVVTEPKQPTKEGYIFDGWFIDNKKWNFNDAVSEDIKLVAQWSVKKSEPGKPSEDTEPKDDNKKPNDDTKEEIPVTDTTEEVTPVREPEPPIKTVPPKYEPKDNKNDGDKQEEITTEETETTQEPYTETTLQENTEKKPKPVITEEKPIYANTIDDTENNKSAMARFLERVKIVAIVFSITLLAGLGILGFILILLAWLRRVKVQNDKNTDEYEDEKYETVYKTSVKTEGNRIAELFNKEDRVWTLTIPEKVIEEKVTDYYKVILKKGFCKRHNGEQIIIILDSEDEENIKELGFVVDKEENEIMFDLNQTE